MPARLHFRADDDVSRFLAERDTALARVIRRVGAVEAPAVADPLTALVRAIVGQQLSEAAAGAIFARIETGIGLSAPALACASDAAWRAAGVSRRKAVYVQGIARAVLDGALDLPAFATLDDASVERSLMRLPGVGRWTARTFLLFGLGRPDVVVADDVGIRAAAGRMLGLGRAATHDELAAAAERWRPHRSAAMLYLYNDGRARKPGGPS